jgi:hypothetical protein
MNMITLLRFMQAAVAGIDPTTLDLGLLHPCVRHYVESLAPSPAPCANPLTTTQPRASSVQSPLVDSAPNKECGGEEELEAVSFDDDAWLTESYVEDTPVFEPSFVEQTAPIANGSSTDDKVAAFIMQIIAATSGAPCEEREEVLAFDATIADFIASSTAQDRDISVEYSWEDDESAGQMLELGFMIDGSEDDFATSAELQHSRNAQQLVAFSHCGTSDSNPGVWQPADLDATISIASAENVHERAALLLPSYKRRRR